MLRCGNICNSAQTKHVKLFEFEMHLQNIELFFDIKIFHRFDNIRITIPR